MRAAAIALALLLAACGSDGDTTASTPSTAPTTTSTTAPPADKDNAKAEAIVLAEADMPGYTLVPDEEPELEDGTVWSEFNACGQGNPVFGPDDSLPDRADTTEFEKGELIQVTDMAEFWPSEPEYKAAFDILASDQFLACWEGSWIRQFAGEDLGGASIGTVKSTRKTVAAPAGVDNALAITTTVTFTAGAVKVNMRMDATLLRKGRAGAYLTYMAPERAYPDAENDRLVGILAQRLVANAG